MRLHAFRLGAALLLCSSVLFVRGTAHAQDQGALATNANAAMQRMTSQLTSALAASAENVAKADVRAAIVAGQEAVAALQTLRDVATDDVIRSRSEAALTQTQNAVSKAQAALTQSGDAFRSTVEAARGEVAEAVAEFLPVLQLVPAPSVSVVAELPKSGEGDLVGFGLLGIGLTGLALLLAGTMLKHRSASLA